MAAAARLTALNNYLANTLGLAAAQRTALNEQGLDSIDVFATLTENEITSICSNVRRPGGVVVNPVAGRGRAAAVAAAAGGMMTNPGVLIGYVYEKRLKMLRFYCCYLERVQRDFDDNAATLGVLTNCYGLKELEEAEDDEAKAPEKLSDVKNIRQTLENLDTYLLRKRGSWNIPLAYVVREVVALPAPANDPGFGMPSYELELIRRAPHDGRYYTEDLKAVWMVIRAITHDGPAWNWVQSFARNLDGRGAYMALKRHYLGESFSSRLRSNADSVLETAFYDGRVRSFTFERYCETLKGAFSDIEATEEIVSETRKVRILLTGILDNRLNQAKSQVLATPDLKATFESAANFIAQFLDEKKSYSQGQRNNIQQRNVSAYGSSSGRGRGRGRSGEGRGSGRSSGRGRGRSGRGRGGRSGRSGTDTVTDRYYTHEQWTRLTPEQQQRVRDLRADRDRQRGVEAVNTRNTRQRTEENTDESSNNHQTNNERNSEATSAGAQIESRRVSAVRRL